MKRQKIIQQEEEPRVIVDILEELLNGSPTVIKQLEQLPNRQLILLSILFFNVKLVGLEQGIKYIENPWSDVVKMIETIDKLQRDTQQFIINQVNCSELLDHQSSLYQIVSQFYDTIFNEAAQLIFEIEFLQRTFEWVTQLSQSNIRMVRRACMELIFLICSKVEKHLKLSENDLQVSQCEKFVRNILEYLVTYRSMDTYCKIRKITCEICFRFLEHSHSVGDLFNKNDDTRELSLRELHKMLKVNSQAVLKFVESQQEIIVGLIFDKNESIQLNLLNFARDLIENHDFEFNTESRHAFERQLFAINPKVRFMIAQTIHLFLPSLKKQDNFDVNTESLLNLIDFFVKVTDNQFTYDDCYNFFSPFIPTHGYLLNPSSYSKLLKRNTKFNSVALFVFAVTIQHSIAQLKLEDIAKEQFENIQNQFTEWFLEHNFNTFIGLKNETIIEANLRVYSQFSILNVGANQLEALQLTLIDEFNQNRNPIHLDLIAKILSQMFNMNQKSLILTTFCQAQNQLFNQNPNEHSIIKVRILLQHRLVRWISIMGPVDRLSLADDLPNEFMLEILQVYHQALQVALRSLMMHYKMRNREQYLNQQKSICNKFYTYCFKLFPVRELQLDVLQVIIKQLIYTNNYKITKKNMHYPLTDERIQQIYSLLHHALLSPLLKNSVIDLSSKQIILLRDLLQLFTVSPIFLNRYLGLRTLVDLILISAKDQFLRERVALQAKISALLALDTQQFWIAIRNSIEIAKNNEFVLSELARLSIPAYLKLVNPKNLFMRRQMFVQFVAQAFDKHESVELITFLVSAFKNPVRVINILQIDRNTFKRLSIYFENKSKEFQDNDSLPKELYVRYSKFEKAMRSIFQKNNGLSNQEMEKIQAKNNAQKENIPKIAILKPKDKPKKGALLKQQKPND